MTDTKLIQNLNSLFGSDRSILRKKLIDVCKKTSKWERMGREIRKKTRQPTNIHPCLFEDTFEKLNNPQADMFWLGDSAYYYEILLNSGVKSGLDWDKKLALKCGGTAKLCVVWASLLLPYYAMDTYCMKYTPKPGEFEFSPYVPSKKREKQIVSRVRDVMREHELTRMTKKLANRKVPKAITDCREKGEATVFDCLFSDTQCYQEDYVRLSDGREPITGAYSATTVGWYERLDRKGNVIERSTWREFPSGDRVAIHLDKRFRVVEIRTIQSGPGSKHRSEMVLDIKKKRLRTKTS